MWVSGTQSAHTLAEGDSISYGSMLTTLLLASQQLPLAAASMSDAETAAAAAQPPAEGSSRDLEVLQELHAATCQFEALDLDRQQELLQKSRISALISSLQWQLAILLQMYLPHASAVQEEAEVCSVVPCNVAGIDKLSWSRC